MAQAKQDKEVKSIFSQKYMDIPGAILKVRAKPHDAADNIYLFYLFI